MFIGDAMKIYFAGSIRGGRQDKDLYLEIIKYLRKYGDVLTEHVGNSYLTSKGESVSQSEIYGRDMQWLRESDVVVAEVTTASLGVGYELGASECKGKRVLCLYRGETGSLSSMIAGNRYFTIRTYDELGEAFRHIDEFMKVK